MAAKRTKYGLLLAPGAGSDSTSSALLAIEAAAPESFVVHRMDFPYRKAGRKAPDRQPVLLDAVIAEATAFAKVNRLKPENIVLGGRSMGGRMCSIAAAEGLPALGLLLVSYPLHPPGRPEKLRVEHFPLITCPSLFISGKRDAFGTPTEIRRHVRKISGDVQRHWIEGGDHGLKRFDAEVAKASSKWMANLIA